LGTAAQRIETDIIPLTRAPVHASHLHRVPTSGPANQQIHPAAHPHSSHAPATVLRLPPGADRIDLRILRTLQRCGRMSYQKLGQEVHLSPTAVFERVKRLEREGFILGYEARLDAARLGAGRTLYLEVCLERACIGAMERFNDAVRACPEIMECHLVAGDCDYLVKIRVADDQADDELPASIRALPGVRDIRTFGVKSGLKDERALSF
jgi:Lrp/AsnC family transcriptional regulator, leucine-responsive regulatory protein